MKTTISTSTLIATINHKGAELVSLINLSNKEYIWEGNSAFWDKHSPVLFPIVGTLKDNQYLHNGKTHFLSRHGFARDMEFELIKKTKNHVAFLLVNSEETFRSYPFKFELQISYTLDSRGLEITYQVINKNPFKMPFSIGAHPAFALPGKFENYQIIFEKEEELICYQLENNLISEHTYQLPLEKKKLPLSYSLFENDTLIFKKIKSSYVDIFEKNKPLLRIRFKGFPSLGIWTKNNAPFICIEPWLGYSDTVKNSGKLLKKEGILILNSAENFKAKLNIEIL